ncbi:glycosyltransferase [Deinococcus aerophilus]|uniref:Glycosyltransferase 2-like domain-containing protein n=1 Tax=Deinococcus aerophilus TaxID=522488 RepID=A0ABQ2GIZ5_9DEIO|nr:glycosyltransferase [Deinococcus aerophilus]GGL98673.1 hypothetical protein GCM10010841_03890 [Deinococcus aerophilus]
MFPRYLSHVVVALPARDEAQRIGATLRALGQQVDGGGRPLSGYTVAVLANNCRDKTAQQARRATPAGLKLRVREVCLPPERAGVVEARRQAMDWAAVLAGNDGVLVSTDADTCPEPDWLWQLLAPIQAGADAAAGRILLNPRGIADPIIHHTQQLDDAYRLAACELTARLNPDPADPWPNHWQHFGASLALSVRAYRAVGGIPDVACLEDVALVQALRRADLTLRHTPHARVHTSARLTGRVPVGLSTQLAEWRCGPDAWTVPGGAEVAALARAEAALRARYRGICNGDLCALWLTTPERLCRALQAPTLGQALEAAHAARLEEGVWMRQYPPVPVAQALEGIRALLYVGARPDAEPVEVQRGSPA